jgi:acyl-coenzyme A thioesterase PaaI-like protein
MSGFDVAAANRMLAERFAPWVQDLGLVAETVEPGRVTMRLPFNERLTRFGGMVSGQALMAVADTSMVFAIAAKVGQFQDCATVSQTTSFFRAASGVDLICDTRLLKFGRTLCFGEALLFGVDRPSDPVAQATMTYALASPR